MRGLNTGLPLRDPHLTKLLGGLKQGTAYGVGAEQKVGKTAFIIEQFILGPYLDDPDVNARWYYWPTEMTRVKTELGMVATIADWLYNKSFSVEYLSGHCKDDKGDPITMSLRDYELVRHIYHNYIIPLMGEYDDQGNMITPGKVTFFDYRENPTGIYKYMVKTMQQYGEIRTKEMGKSRILEGFTPYDPSMFHIGMIDHIRGLERERGFNAKDNIDKMGDYVMMTRNIFNMSWVVTSHLNRGNNDVMRLKLLGENMYPATESWKDSGNFPELADIIINLFQPTDEKYGLIGRGRHMGFDIRPFIRRSNYRTVHITENRDGPAPLHLGYRFRGAEKVFEFVTHLPPRG